MSLCRGYVGLRQVARAFGMLGMFFVMLIAFLAARAEGQCHDVLLEAGVNDNFSTADRPELTSPSPGLLILVDPQLRVDFDSTLINKHFGHTFSIPRDSCIVGARLEFRAKPLDGSTNDAISMGFVDSGGQFVNTRWTAFFGSGNAGFPILVPAQQWVPPAVNVFLLDLQALPGGVNLLLDSSMLSDLWTSTFRTTPALTT